MTFNHQKCGLKAGFKRVLRTSIHPHRESSDLDNELSEESDKFRFLRTSCFTNLKGTDGLIMTKESVMWISIPLDLSSRSFVPLPCFNRSCRPTPFLDLPSYSEGSTHLTHTGCRGEL